MKRPSAASGLAACALVLLGLAATMAHGQDRRAAGGGPRVTATKPSQGQIIEPGDYTLSVTFDRAMEPGTYSFVETNEGLFPECESAPQMSVDRRSFFLRCIARAGKKQAVWFNRGHLMNFRSADTGQSSTPFKLTFSVRPEN